MFNTTIHKHETRVTPVTRVVEKSITPDKVTDVYKEVREEVEDSFVRGFRVDNNLMKGVVIELAPDYANNTRKIITRFVLNDKEYIYRDEFVDDNYSLDQASAIRKLADYYRFEIEKTLVQDTAKAYLFNK